MKYSNHFLFAKCLSKNYSYLFWYIILAETQFRVVFRCIVFSATLFKLFCVITRMNTWIDSVF